MRLLHCAATLCAMSEMAKYPFMTRRTGSKNLYYRRAVPDHLRSPDRPKQIWKSLGTPDHREARASYARVNLETEALFEVWKSGQEELIPTKRAAAASVGSVPLTSSLLRRLSDDHYLAVYDDDFTWRGKLWKQVCKDEDAFWREEIIRHPKDDEVALGSVPHSYYWRLMESPDLEEVFLYCIHMERRSKLSRARRNYELGHTEGIDAAVRSATKRRGLVLDDEGESRLRQSLLKAEILALEDAVNGFEARIRTVECDQNSSAAIVADVKPSEMASKLIELYITEAARTSSWPVKTTNRKRAELQEFISIAGDKPSNTYTNADGNLFKEVQLKLPANRQSKMLKGLSPLQQAALVEKMVASGDKLALLSPLTINDKIGTVILFFDWLKPRGCAPSQNPLLGLSLSRPSRGKRSKSRHPWSVDELNKMFSAPIYTGCKSLSRWSEAGSLVPTDSAIYWIPLIGLFTGMRLGEIVQLRTSDFKTDGILSYFDITTSIEAHDDDESEPTKSLKNAYSRRCIPVHAELKRLGIIDVVEARKRGNVGRLFPEFQRAKDDHSWSKTFSKHFTRFRRSIGCTRKGITFHSLRHNVEDALRNADVRKEVRDAVQGHGETGISREYGTGYYLTTLNEAVQKIRYPGLALPNRSI